MQVLAMHFQAVDLEVDDRWWLGRGVVVKR